jgi:signal transduction histidine kinase
MGTQHLLVLQKELARERAVETLRRIQENFINTMSHEVRTPLTSIIGFADLLLDEGRLTSEERKEFAQIIRDEGRRLATLVNDCLDLSCLEKGSSQLARTETNIVDLVHDAIAELRPDIERKHLQIDENAHADTLTASIDPDRMKHALLNILGNSVKYSPENAHIFVKIRHVSGFVEIQVWDEGPHVPPEQLPHLFHVFASESRPEKGIRGTGLGLAIARYLVEIHGGSVGVRSKTGRGMTFIVRFPAS